MDAIQQFLIIIIIVLTGLLVVVGYYVLLIVMDVRKALKRLNLILDDSVIGGGLIRPEKLTGLVEMFRKNRSMRTKKHGEISEKTDDYNR